MAPIGTLVTIVLCVYIVFSMLYSSHLQDKDLEGYNGRKH